MERARAYLQLGEEDSGAASSIDVHTGTLPSFYETFALRGIRLHRVQPGVVSCTFKVPPHLTDMDGNLAKGAIANLVDEVGGAAVYVEGAPMNVSVDMCISFLSSAKLDEELEITSRILGVRGNYKGTIVVVKNKKTGELIAEGRHSLLGRHPSKL